MQLLMDKGEKLSFDRKYRPSRISDYVGNSSLIRMIEAQVRNETLPHTILMQGPRGCGKTSMARLIAKELQCIGKKKGELSCGVCPNCTELDKYILQGKKINNNIEYDMTNFGGVEEIRDIVASMLNRPMYPMKKSIYILDEIQKASEASQNVLLKIAEEPKDYLYIILCTTDPEKLITPLKSRFRSFDVKRSSQDDIVNRLIYIARQESIRYDVEAIKLIASMTNGIIREAIIALEKVASCGDVTVEETLDKLQLVDYDVYIEFFDVLSKDIVSVLSFIEDLNQKGIEYQKFIKGMSRFVLDCINMRNGIRLEFYSESAYKKVRKVFKKFDDRELFLILDSIKDTITFFSSTRDFEEMAIKLFAIKINKKEWFTRDGFDIINKLDGSLKTENDLTKFRYASVSKKIKESSFDNSNKTLEDYKDILNMFDNAKVVE